MYRKFSQQFEFLLCSVILPLVPYPLPSDIFDYRDALGRVAAKMEGKMAEGSSSLKECSSLAKQEESEGRRMESFRKVMRKCLDKIMATGR